MKAQQYRWFPTKDTNLENCFHVVSTYKRRYVHISFDLWRSKYNFTKDGSKQIGEICHSYATEWIKRARAKEVPFPRDGIMYSTEPSTSFGMTVLKEDAEDMVRRFWDVLWDYGHYGNLKVFTIDGN